MVGFAVSDLRHTAVNLEMLAELGTPFLLARCGKGESNWLSTTFLSFPFYKANGSHLPSRASCPGSALPFEISAGERSRSPFSGQFPSCPCHGSMPASSLSPRALAADLPPHLYQTSWIEVLAEEVAISKGPGEMQTFSAA